MQVRPTTKRLHLLFAGLLALAACEGESEKPPRDAPGENDDDTDDDVDDDSDSPRDEAKRDAGAANGGSTKSDASKPREDGKLDASGADPSADGAARDAKSDMQSSRSDAGASPSGDASVDEGPAVACNPADKKPDPMNVPTSSIRRYAGQTIAPAKGPYKPVLESDRGAPRAWNGRSFALSVRDRPGAGRGRRSRTRA